MYRLVAGEHGRRQCPVCFEADPRWMGKNVLVRFEGGCETPAQVDSADGKALVRFILDELGAGESVGFDLVEDQPRASGMTLLKTDHALEIREGARFVTRYYYGEDIAKPHLGPFYEKYGGVLTRVDFEVTEHKHHRGLWVSHGDLNGVDFWSEDPNHGIIRPQTIDGVAEGPVFAGFTARNLWTTHGMEPVCDEVTRVTVYRMSAAIRVIDLDVTLTASYAPLTFGRTKEAGAIAVRMADSMIVKNGGRFETPTGINEGEIWMKRAAWCDYHGVAGGRRAGVAVLECPSNEDAPTHWHARDYGLMAPNNSLMMPIRVLEKSGSIRWRFRVIIHNGDTRDAGIANRYMDYVSAPRVESPDQVSV